MTEAPYIYFIERDLVAVQSRTQADGAHGVGLIGRYGMTGLGILLGTVRASLRIAVQTPGEAYRMAAGDRAMLLEESAALRLMGLGYIQALMTQAAHVSLCNARHPMKHGVKRWRLVAHDWLGEDEVCVSHQLIANLLGVRRASVTEEIQGLERAGVVQQQRGCISVLSREELERSGCECHKLIRADYQRLHRTLDN